jgi:hypothetical protein
MPGSLAPAARPSNPVTSSATIGGLAGLLGGGMVLLGWFLPWLDFGFGFLGVGSGPQIVFGVLSVGLIGGGFAEDASGLLILCVTLLVVALLLVVPVMGFLAARDGWGLFEDRMAGDKLAPSFALKDAERVRSRLQTVLILMALSFVAASVVSVGALGSGFWFTALGALGGYLAASYARTQLRRVNTQSKPSKWPE